MSPENLIDKVKDKETFIQFLDALILDRQDAENLERDNPTKYQWDGANNWQNSSISSFLESASMYLIEGPHRHEGDKINWKDLAAFLYFGKIYE